MADLILVERDRGQAWTDNYLFMEFAINNLLELGGTEQKIRDEFEEALRIGLESLAELREWEDAQ